ncbi:HD domain-containing protein [Gluconobacter sp. Dm-62]|uniref:HD domain-containing protein n=1 Tax=Gluconobacter sp. Dm-62 TaxID=2799804 RepID=UPI001B8C8AD9|nr:HD domain-containing protein [Gluconobacter sp. Dm-62]MBS1102969.1 HD domain-containing protein [Gluconobacter sp. Dm-62]
MTKGDLEKRLDFLREASRLKDILRRTYTHSGQTESTAEHTWALCLLVMTFADQLEGIDLLKLLKICILHDLGEAIHGDVPAISLHASANKAAQEREDLLTIMAPLPSDLQAEFLALWDEYENAASPEARLAKAFDKIETISQHNAGLNPDDFDHTFNLTYGRKYTDTTELTRRIRAILDDETRRNMLRSQNMVAG